MNIYYIPTSEPNGNMQQKQMHAMYALYLSITSNLAMNAIVYEHWAKIRIVNEIPKNTILSLL